MEKKKMKIREIVQLSPDLRQDLNPFTEWNLTQKLDFLKPILESGETKNIAIVYDEINNILLDGRQVFITLKKYVESEIEDKDSSLTQSEKERILDIEFQVFFVKGLEFNQQFELFNDLNK